MAKKKKGPAAKGPAKNGEGDTAEPTNAVTSDGGGAVPSSSGSVGSRGSSYVSFRGPRIFAKKGEYIPGACAREEAAHREEDAEHEAARLLRGGPSTRRTAFLAARRSARHAPTARPGSASSTTRTTRSRRNSSATSSPARGSPACRGSSPSPKPCRTWGWRASTWGTRRRLSAT